MVLSLVVRGGIWIIVGRYILKLDSYSHSPLISFCKEIRALILSRRHSTGNRTLPLSIWLTGGEVANLLIFNAIPPSSV